MSKQKKVRAGEGLADRQYQILSAIQLRNAECPERGASLKEVAALVGLSLWTVRRELDSPAVQRWLVPRIEFERNYLRLAKPLPVRVVA